jgi:hypothetical protein
MSDVQIEKMARRMCKNMGLDPNEIVAHGVLDTLTEKERLKYSEGVPMVAVYSPRWQLYRAEAEKALSSQRVAEIKELEWQEKKSDSGLITYRAMGIFDQEFWVQNIGDGDNLFHTHHQAVEYASNFLGAAKSAKSAKMIVQNFYENEIRKGLICSN